MPTSAHVKVLEQLENLTRVGDRHLAGEKSNAPISDHAALRFKVAVSTA